MSGEIEFLDLDPAQDAAGEHTAARTSPTAWSAGAVLGWTAGAVLAVVASWQMIYRIRLGLDGTYGADGWGRLRVHERGATSAGGHVGRFGIVLCCAAALLILAATLAAVERARARRGRRINAGRAASHLGLAATMLCAGTAAAVYLDVHAMAESVSSEGAPDFPAPALAYGPFLWCCLAAVLCGLAGTTARLMAARQSDGART